MVGGAPGQADRSLRLARRAAARSRGRRRRGKLVRAGGVRTKIQQRALEARRRKKSWILPAWGTGRRRVVVEALFVVTGVLSLPVVGRSSIVVDCPPGRLTRWLQEPRSCTTAALSCSQSVKESKRLPIPTGGSSTPTGWFPGVTWFRSASLHFGINDPRHGERGGLPPWLCRSPTCRWEPPPCTCRAAPWRP